MTARPILRWAGSKRQLLPILREHVPPSFRRYVEPFAGSACLFFALRPRFAILGDINTDLIKTYVEVKYRHSLVAKILSHLPKDQELYLGLRGIDPSQLPRDARAARFIYLNRCCFNGIYRTNLKGQFNVPYGGAKSGDLPSADHLRSCASALRVATLLNCDFEDVLTRVRFGDFVYMDPPFSVRNQRVFKEYDATAFGSEQLQRLRNWLERFASSGIRFLVSYAESEEAEVLSRGFKIRRADARRNVAGFAEQRCVARELLIFN